MSTTGVSSSSSSGSALSTAEQIAAANKSAAQKILGSLSAGSGVDTAALAQNLVDAEKVPQQNAINAKITKNEKEISGYSAVMFMLKDLNTAVAELKDTSDFNTLKVTGGEATSYTLNTTSSSKAGSHRIRVNALYQEQVSVSTKFASNTTRINSDQPFSMTLTIGSTANAIAVAPNSSGEITPTEVVAAINGAALDVTAKLVNSGTSTSPDYRIVLTGKPGAEKSFSLTATNTTTAPAVTTVDGDAITPSTETSTVAFQALARGDQLSVGGLTLTATESMSDAEVAAAFASVAAGTTPGNGAKYSFTGSLSGFSSSAVANGNEVVFTSTTADTNVTNLVTSLTPGSLSLTQLQAASDAEVVVNGVTYTRQTNAVDDILEGTTLQLSAVSTTTTLATINRDSTPIETKLQAMVDAYNNAQSLLKEVSDPKSKLDTYGATLVGSSTVRLISSKLRSLISANSTTPGTSISALWQLGIKFDSAGQMSLDKTKLKSALNDYPDDVVTALTGNTDNLSQYDTTTASGVMGETWRAINSLMSSSGPLMTQSDNANNKITEYKSQLTALDARMQRLLDRYTKQFASMQSLVGNTNSLKTSLESSFAGLMAMYTGKNS